MAYKPRHTHTHTHTHPETLEVREKSQVAISDTATHRPKHARGAKIAVSLFATWVFPLASIVSRVCVGVRVPWFVCDTCVS
jgi:hypothetical protein